MRPEDLLGREFDWLACDAAGEVALFCTAGGGYPPNVFVGAIDEFDAALDGLLRLSASTTGTFVEDAIDERVWKPAVERGLYIFDSDVDGGPYRRVGMPKVPVRVLSLPLILREVFERIRLPIHFRDSNAITKQIILRAGF
jgi:hypothetical protein